MKYKILAALIALGGLTAPGAASAACPDGEFSWFERTGTGEEGDPFVAHEHCAKTATTGSPAATTGGITASPVLDSDGNQVVVDGHPISSGAIVQPVGFSKVYGFNGTAMGNGAAVGSASCAAGWVMGDMGLDCTPTAAEAAAHYHPEAEDAPAACDSGWSVAGDTCEPTSATTTAAFSRKSVNGGTAIGAGASAQGHGGTAVGFGASVGEGHEGSTAIGANAKTTKARQVMIGTKDDTVTAPGVAKGMAPGSSALVTTDSEGNLGNDGGATANQITALQGMSTVHGAQIAELHKDVKRLQGGIALATAITVPHVDIDKKLALTISGAGYDGQGAIAAAAALRISSNVQGFVGGGVAFDGGPAAVKGGLTFQW